MMVVVARPRVIFHHLQNGNYYFLQIVKRLVKQVNAMDGWLVDYDCS